MIAKIPIIGQRRNHGKKSSLSHIHPRRPRINIGQNFIGNRAGPVGKFFDGDAGATPFKSDPKGMTATALLIKQVFLQFC